MNLANRHLFIAAACCTGSELLNAFSLSQIFSHTLHVPCSAGSKRKAMHNPSKNKLPGGEPLSQHRSAAMGASSMHRGPFGGVPKELAAWVGETALGTSYLNHN